MSKISTRNLWLVISITLCTVVTLSYALSAGASTTSRVDDPHLETIIRGLEHRASLIQSFRGRFEVQHDDDRKQPGIQQDAVKIVYEWAREGNKQIATRFPAGARGQAMAYLCVDDVLQRLLHYPPGEPLTSSLEITRKLGRHERASLHPYERFFGMYYREIPLEEFLRQAIEASPDEIEELVVRPPEEGDASVWTVSVTSPAFIISGLVRVQTLIHVSERLGFAVVGREVYLMRPGVRNPKPELYQRTEYGDFVRFGNELWLARSATVEAWKTPLCTEGMARYPHSVSRVTDMFVNEPVPAGAFELDIPEDALWSDIDTGKRIQPQDREPADGVAEARAILRGLEYRSAALQDFSATVVERRTMTRADRVDPTQAGYVVTAASGIAPVVRATGETPEALAPSATGWPTVAVAHDIDLLHRAELRQGWSWAETIVLSPSPDGAEGTDAPDPATPFDSPRAVCFSDGERVVEVDYASSCCGIERAPDLRLAVPAVARILSDLLVTVSPAGLEALRDDYLGTYVNEFPPIVIGTEDVNGIPCQVLQLQGRCTRHRYWVGTKHSFIVMREDVLTYKDGAPDEPESYCIQERSDVIQTGDTMWVPQQWQEAYYIYHSNATPPTWEWFETRQLRAERLHLAPQSVVGPLDLNFLIPLGFMVLDRTQNMGWIQGEIREVMDLMSAFADPIEFMRRGGGPE